MIIPEWVNPSLIALVWPEHLPSGVGTRLKGFYSDFIRLLLREDINILLLYCEPTDLQKVKNLFGQDNMTFQLVPKVSDIWIRDFGPLFYAENGILKAIKFLYQPSYAYSAKEIDWFANNNEVGFNLIKPIPEKIELNGCELILDGGNFVHNGFGTGIITNRIFSDNEHLFEHEIRDILKEKAGIKELFIIPSEPGDDTGHIDGLVRFLDPNTLAVLKYPDKYVQDDSNISKEDYNASVIVVSKIAEYFRKNNFNIISIPNSIPKGGVHKIKDKKTFENATGNYMNFLRAGNKIFFPQYDNHVDDKIGYQVLSDYFENFHSEVKVIRVPFNATPLAEYGGIINCVTLQLFDENSLYYDPFDKFIPVAKEVYEDKLKTIYLALKRADFTSNKDYRNEKVIQVDMNSCMISSPRNLQEISKYLDPIWIDPVSDNPQLLIQRILTFSPFEIRKLWNIFTDGK